MCFNFNLKTNKVVIFSKTIQIIVTFLISESLAPRETPKISYRSGSAIFANGSDFVTSLVCRATLFGPVLIRPTDGKPRGHTALWNCLLVTFICHIYALNFVLYISRVITSLSQVALFSPQDSSDFSTSEFPLKSARN